MQLTISGHQIDLTDSMKNYISEKMERIERHFDHLNSIYPTRALRDRQHVCLY